MKTAVAVAVSVLLYGTGAVHAADEAVNNRTADKTPSAIETSMFDEQPGVAERGRLNNGMFSNRDSYGHILSDPGLFVTSEKERAVATTEGASAIETSMFEERPGTRMDTERAPLDNGMFSNRDSYGHVLSNPYILTGEGRAVTAETERAATTTEASAIELSMFDEQPGAAERGQLNNGMFNNRDSYGHILSDPELFGK